MAEPEIAAVEAPQLAADSVSGPRFWVETWGCQMNVYDSERFAGQLRELGYRPAVSAEDADLILLNTCSVREKAAEKVFSRLGRLQPLKRPNPRLRVRLAR